MYPFSSPKCSLIRTKKVTSPLIVPSVSTSYHVLVIPISPDKNIHCPILTHHFILHSNDSNISCITSGYSLSTLPPKHPWTDTKKGALCIRLPVSTPYRGGCDINFIPYPIISSCAPSLWPGLPWGHLLTQRLTFVRSLLRYYLY